MVKVSDEEGKEYEAVAYLYADPSNLEPKDWDLDKFDKEHKTTFANDHLNTK